MDIIDTFDKDGFVVLRNFLDAKDVNQLRQSAIEVFRTTFRYLGYPHESDSIQKSMIALFNEHPDTFQNLGKHLQQGLPELYKLSVHESIVDLVKNLGVLQPIMCTRPVLFFNHPKLAKLQHYYKTPTHQDWPSMQSSTDSVVIWIPLVDVTPENGAVRFYKGSHKLGVLPYESVGGFATVTPPDSRFERVQPSLSVGDIVAFSTFTVHESGDIDNDAIRWSCSFRYTNMADTDFLLRGSPCPYSYRSLATT